MFVFVIYLVLISSIFLHVNYRNKHNRIIYAFRLIDYLFQQSQKILSESPG